MINKGLMLVVSGPAGSGKGTVNGMLMKREDFAFSVSATTRQPRPGEIDGVNYHYVSREEFLARIESGDMLEYTEYCGNFYGTPKKQFFQMIEDGFVPVLEIETDGAAQVMEKLDSFQSVYLSPPDYATLEARLRGRGTETEEKICARLARTREELPLLAKYDYVVYNHDHREMDCAEDIMAIVRAESCAMRRHPDAPDEYFNT